MRHLSPKTSILYPLLCFITIYTFMIGTPQTIAFDGLAKHKVNYSLGHHVSKTASQPIFKPFPPAIQASAYVLIDAHSGRVLASKNENKQVTPASLTKMMVSYLASAALDLDRITLEEKVNISQKAGSTGGSRMFIAPNTYVTVRDLLRGIIVQSGNDASIALAEYLAGDEKNFVEIMNQQAKRFNMSGTQFMNVSGLPQAGHYTTALDLATLARAIVLDFPKDYAWYSEKSFSYSGITQNNRNRLLFWNVGVDGIKTGDTKESGFCIAASSMKNDMRLVAIVMGAPTKKARLDGAYTLLKYGFDFFETQKIYSAYEPIIKNRIWFGKPLKVTAGLEHDLYVTVLRGYSKHLKKVVTINKHLRAPLTKSSAVGQVQITLNGEVLTDISLVSLHPVAKASWWRRWWDHLLLFFVRQWR